MKVVGCCNAYVFRPLGWVPATSTTSSSSTSTTTVVPTTTTSTTITTSTTTTVVPTTTTTTTILITTTTTSSTTLEPTTTTTTTVSPPFIEFTVDDLSVTLDNLGIINPLDVSEWNTALDNWYGDTTGVAFTSVEVIGNNVKLIGSLETLEVLYLPGLGLVDFSTNGTFPSTTEMNLTFNSLTSFTLLAPFLPGVQKLLLNDNLLTDFDPAYILPEGLTDINLDNNQIVTFNPSLPLPSTLVFLSLGINKIVTFNPTIPLPALYQLLLYSNQIVVFDPSPGILSSGTVHLSLADNLIVDFNPTIPLPASLESLALMINKIVVFNPSIPLPSGLRYLYLDDNLIVTFNPTIALPTTLETLVLSRNPLSGFAPTAVPFPNLIALLLLNCNSLTFNTNLIQSNIVNLELTTNGLSTATVDAVLARCVAVGMNTGGVFLLGNSPASPAGAANAVILVGNGVTVQI